MLTEDQIEAMARANWPEIEWDDESLAESAHLREAFRAGVRAVIAAHEAKAEPFGYFRAEPMGWTDCAADDEGAIALYERPAASAVPDVDSLAQFIRQIDGSHTMGTAALAERICEWLNDRKATEQAAPAVPQGEPVHQFRKVHCADWYDGHPDHGDGGGPYEERTLYTSTPAPPQEPAVPQELCPTCGEDRPFSGTCGTSDSDTKALCKRKCKPPQEPVKRPQNCGTSYCSCIECVCEPEPVTLTDSTIDAAAKVLAERFDYSWEHMPEQGRENMRKNVRNVVAALRGKEGK